MSENNIVPLDVAEETRLPKPIGYRLLIKLPEVKETYGNSGIVKASSAMHQDQILTNMGLVVDMGEQAYADKDRFPAGPWCQVGDVVMFRTNTGTRFKVNDTEYRLMNDDSVEAVVPDPSAVSRVL